MPSALAEMHSLAMTTSARPVRCTAPKAVAPSRARAIVTSVRSDFAHGCCGTAGFQRSRGVVKARVSLRVIAVFEKFTERAIKAVMLGQQEAKALSRKEVGPEHVLIGLIAEESSKKGGYLGFGASIDLAREKAALLTGARRNGEHEKPDGAYAVSPVERGGTRETPFSLGAKRVFEAALAESQSSGMSFIAPEHIAVACSLLDDVTLVAFFQSIGVDRTVLRTEARRRLDLERERERGIDKKAQTNSPAGPRTDTKSQQQGTALARQTHNQKQRNSPLASFCVDLTEKARAGTVDPVIGRETEVERVVQILARRSKNNPILLGEPGVGKTAIAEGLALRIARGDVPDFLAHKKVVSLDVGLLMAGAKERGELEQRVTGLVEEIKQRGDVVLVIDEVHTLVGSGAVGRRSGSGGGGGLDISNLLKVPLARGELQCIGATTVKEHRLYIEKDPALERRFQPVIVEEPNEDDAVEILFGLRSRYESHHGCQYTDDALEAAVKISSRYIPDRFLPDKALDLIDEAGSKARIDRYFEIKESDQNAGATLDAVSMEQMDQWRQLKEVRTMKELRISEENFEEASLLRAREMEVTKALVANGVASGSISHENLVVGVSEIEHIASCWSGVPVQKITQHESGVLTNMAGTLSKDVVGQAEAVGAVTRAMRRARCGLNSADRPIASLLFAGPTGVGKTELVKALAERFFGSQDNMTRLDMSEYMERHSVSKLIGAPPGYAGFGQGGTLTEAVRRKPFGVLLLDEIEKAHPDVWNVLLQMMEDGRLTDSNGRVVSFKNTLIVLTSNVGSKAIAKGGNTLGFLVDVDENSEDSAAYGRMRLKVLDELKTVFRPEMLNRLDEIVCFKQLEQAHVIEIARLMLRETADRMRVKGMEMALTKSAMAKLLEVGFDKEYGARPLRRAITSIVDDNLSEALLRGTINEGDVALVDYDPGYGSLTSTNSPKEATKGSGAPNAYHGVRVVGISGDEYSARNLDAAWCSFGNDFEEEEENVEELTYQQGRVVGNVVARGPVTNDVVA